MSRWVASGQRFFAALVLLIGCGSTLVALWHAPQFLGTHDWDQMESGRLLVRRSIVEFGQFPFWDPFACGGFSAWGGVESDTTVISPFLPVYLFAPLAIGIRVEATGCLLIAVLGTWLFARRYVKNPLLLSFVCVVSVVNSRWSLQTGAGHTWHLYYAWLPWVMWAFDHVLERCDKHAVGSFGSLKDDGRSPHVSLVPLTPLVGWILITAATLAMMVYSGAIYPLPHAVLFVGLVASLRAYGTRSIRPLVMLFVVGFFAVLLGAPKLLPMMETMGRFPRYVDSRETVPLLTWFAMFLVPRDAGDYTPTLGLDWGYQEYGIYIGVIAFVSVVIGNFLAPRDARVKPLRWLGILCVLFSLGRAGPWFFLHFVPPFRSQHVPTRFLYPGIMFLCVVAAARADDWLAHQTKRIAAKYAIVALFSLAVAVDISRVSSAILRPAFTVEAPTVKPQRYAQTLDVPAELNSAPSNGPPNLTTHQANVGSIQCNTFAGLNMATWHGGTRPIELGARGDGDPDYRGEVFIESGPGIATIQSWSPNRVVVEVRGAPKGAVVVLNQNWDSGWMANGRPTDNVRFTNGYVLERSGETIEFRFVPKKLKAGLALAAIGALLAIVAIAIAVRHDRSLRVVTRAT